MCLTLSVCCRCCCDMWGLVKRQRYDIDMTFSCSYWYQHLIISMCYCVNLCPACLRYLQSNQIYCKCPNLCNRSKQVWKTYFVVTLNAKTYFVVAKCFHFWTWPNNLLLHLNEGCDTVVCCYQTSLCSSCASALWSIWVVLAVCACSAADSSRLLDAVALCEKWSVNIQLWVAIRKIIWQRQQSMF